MQPDRAVADELCSLIDRSPSPYHAVETAVDLLSGAGFAPLDLAGRFSGPGRWFVRRGGSVIAWRQPEGPPRAFRIVGAHTDSPNLRIKPNADRVRAHFRQLGVEVYGGALLNSWLDRDLGLSGRVVVSSDDGPVTHLFRTDEPVLRVPQLAIHLDREIADKGLQLNAQDHLSPVWDLDTERGSEESFADWLADIAEVAPDAILSWDAMVHDLTPSRRSGRGGVFVSAPRLDNLCSSFAAVRALLEVLDGDEDGGDVVPLVCLYDHEEVGSTSSTGADSAMLVGVVERIVAAADGGRDDLHMALAASVCLSADMAHATHPNYADRHEPDHHVTLNEGPVVKINANQRYASDAESIATYLQACADAGVPTQRFVSRTDLPCGSTIGPVTAARLGISTVDVGIAQLAMHSARELCGADDPSWYQASMAAFLPGMNLGAARSVLGVSATDDWATVRDAYRTRIRATHPDLVGPGGNEGTLQVNAAYRTLALARRDGRLHDADAPAASSAPAPRPSRRPRPTVSHQIAGDVRIVGGDTLVLSSPPAETFRRLVEATHALGELSYVDRSAAIFEAVLHLQDGTHASFVVSLQWRAHDATCEAFCTLEALDRAEHLDVSGVLEQLAQFIPADHDDLRTDGS